MALSVLRVGSDTRAARWFRERTEHDPSGAQLPADPVAALADALAIPSRDRAVRVAAARRDALTALETARHSGFFISSILDDGYPEWLRHIPDPPIVLWIDGDPAALDEPGVAVVGSRRATPNGLAQARTLARDLASAGVRVISGLARGVDAAAHRGALEGGSQTLAVLGSGVDVVYPSEHQTLAREVRAQGAVISEYPPGTKPWPGNFPLRNRIISGLSAAVVVVEASSRSGSLITARMGLEQGRDVLAVPGSITSGCYQGCHALIKDGARLVETVDDILDEVGQTGAALGQSGKVLDGNELPFTIHHGEAVTVEELAERTGQPVQRLLADLGRLEAEGLVVRTAGGMFTRLDGSVTNRDRGRT